MPIIVPDERVASTIDVFNKILFFLLFKKFGYVIIGSFDNYHCSFLITYNFLCRINNIFYTIGMRMISVKLNQLDRNNSVSV